MPNSPFMNITVPSKYNTFIFLVLVVSGLAGNYFKYPVFLNIDFIFGSIFAMLALQFFGIGRGILAAAIIASYTYVIWNHPYAVIIMTAEVIAVGWLVERRKIGMVLADMIYWLIVGIPLVYLFYHVVMGSSLSSTYITMTKQAVNGITNVLIARLIFTGYTLHTRTALTSYREIFCNLLISFVLFPILVILMISSRNDFTETDLSIKHSLIENIQHEHLILDNWALDRRTAIVNLAGMAATRTYQQMQPRLEQAAKADHNFLRVGLLDKEATTTAYFPLTDEQGNNNIGKNFADRPYILSLKRTLKPMLSEVVMGKMSPPKPIVTMLAPIVLKGEYNGYIAGVLNLEHIKQNFEMSMRENDMLYTLLDSVGNIIMTNRADQKVMTPFDRGEGILSKTDTQIDQWIPVLPPFTPASERWKMSSYVAETGIGSLNEWKLILEQPVAPFQKALFDKYTNRLTILLFIVFGALVLAEIISRRFVRTLEQLNQITRHLPSQILNNIPVVWPESHIFELHIQIDNFKETATALSQQIQDIQKINMSLEELVEERTNALVASEEKHLSILLTAIDGFWFTDAEGHLLEVNETYCHMSGYSKQELLAMRISDLDVNKSGKDVTVHAHKIISLGNDRFESVHRRKDGTEFNVEVSAKYYPIEDGRFVAFLHDITERKNMEKERQNLEQQFYEAQKYECYGLLASGIAHDFNNILAIIMTQCSLARMDSSNISSYASELEKAVIRGADLCRQLLTYSGKASVTKTQIDMRLLTDEMINLLKATISPNINIRLDCLSDNPVVYGDSSQMRQVVMNLVINASEAIGSENGTIKVSLTDEIITEDTPLKNILLNKINPGRYICLEVTDNGCGMNKEVMQRIFEPFYTTKTTGRGLGTSAILGIVKSHNGSLVLNSIPGCGTTFKIFFPPCAATLMTEDALQGSRTEDWKGCGTILLVDDENVILQSVSYMLKKLGFTVIEAKNGEEALELFRLNFSDIDLVLTDIGMPVMSGYDLYCELKKIKPSLPIILSSGYADSDLKSKIDEDGLAGFLNKPYTFEELQIVLKVFFENHVING